MNFETLLVILIDGGLIIFLLYAINSTRRGNINYRPTTAMPSILKKTQDNGKIQRQSEPISNSTSKPIKTPKPEPKSEEITDITSKDMSEPVSERRIKVVDIEGIGDIYSKKLNEVGIYYIDELLDAGATRQARRELAEKTGISSLRIMDWVNMADLYRISNIGEEWSDLLEEADVNTVVELAQRVPENLYAKLVEINESKNLVRRLPSLEQVEDWIKQAKQLPRVVEY
jgi:predicted flap endonuclease-1-like 5' DNA nuclease